ncbi:MAG: fatty-acyl-CoA synthase [Gammaproteobacteria bacterium]
MIGGAAFPLGMVQAAANRGINAFTAYGMSETCPVITFADMQGCDSIEPGSDLSPRCKTGKATMMVDLRVVDNAMQDVPRGGKVSGEVVVRAPWLTQGYAGNPEGSEELWRGGYLHTGDVGYIDEGGSLHITDRIKDVIKSGGEWISSLALEDVASRAASVAEVAAFGIPDAQWGERPMLVIVAKEGTDAEVVKAEVCDLLQREIDAGVFEKWAMPQRIELVDAIPKTSVGKLDKKVMRLSYQ